MCPRWMRVARRHVFHPLADRAGASDHGRCRRCLLASPYSFPSSKAGGRSCARASHDRSIKNSAQRSSWAEWANARPSRTGFQAEGANCAIFGFIELARAPGDGAPTARGWDKDTRESRPALAPAAPPERGSGIHLTSRAAHARSPVCDAHEELSMSARGALPGSPRRSTATRVRTGAPGFGIAVRQREGAHPAEAEGSGAAR
jgi:hypothetical protein